MGVAFGDCSWAEDPKNGLALAYKLCIGIVPPENKDWHLTRSNVTAETEWMHSLPHQNCEMLPSFKLGDAVARDKNYAGFDRPFSFPARKVGTLERQALKQTMHRRACEHAMTMN